MTQSEQDPAREPAATAEVKELGEVVEAEATAGLSPTGAPTMSVRGKGTPGQMVGLVLAPAFSALGIPVAVVLVLADKPLLLAGVGFLVTQVMALVWWLVLSKAQAGDKKAPPDLDASSG